MPGDHTAADAAGHGCPEASHADCEQVIEVLKTAFVQGRLTKDELGTRVGRALTSHTYAELTEVTTDLPAGLLVARPRRQVARTRPRLSMNAAVSAGAFTMLAALVGMMAAIVIRSEIVLLSAVAGITIVGVLAFGTMMVASWQGEHAKPGKSEGRCITGQ